MIGVHGSGKDDGSEGTTYRARTYLQEVPA